MSCRTRQGRTLLTACLLAAILAATPTASVGKPWNTPYDKYFELPGAEVQKLTNHEGAEIRTVALPHGISIQQRREAGIVTTITTDVNGGPVLCVQDRYVDLLIALEGCRNLRSKPAAHRLAHGLDRINRFVAENWVEPITVEAIEAWIAGKRARMLGHSALYGKQGTVCRDEHVAEALRQIAAVTDAEFEAELDALLAVPRLPAMAPCR